MENFNFQKAEFEYEPYPVCYIPNFFDEATFKELANSYPDFSLFKVGEGHGNKYYLSELGSPDVYHSFLKKNPKWQEFYNYITTKEFSESVFNFLKEHNIDLGHKKFSYTNDVKKKKRSIFSRIKDKKLIRSRFEFAIMPANGGNILPHTDHRLKYVTMVLSFINDNEWKKEWGGGTDVSKPKDHTKIYNMLNKQGKFEDMDVVKTFPFNPNQCVLFIKTYNSWHSVTPMTGPENALRKTVTINIEGII